MRAPAKINLHLGVGPSREDGYHQLATVYQAIGLYDDVTATEADDWSVSVTVTADLDASEVPLDGSNIAIRAGHLLCAHHGIERAARLEIAKSIPVAGGLAGGSADAAAALVALDRLWDLQTSDDDLLAIAGRLGSDVPFALVGGTAYGTGRGELVEPVTDHGHWWWVVVPNAVGLSTAAVYAEYDALGLGEHLRPPQGLFSALAEARPERLAAELHNDLEPAALELRPDLLDIRHEIETAGGYAALLSGSGPTWLALAGDADHARDVASELARDHDVVLCAPGPVAGAHVVTYA
ncbi:4-(cytidine 5'-diphospho)-2-C-methyl-D-erythritol kinase [Nocardioides pocheonensis]|uniref:4-diphosphocytidyl-2-C-methyl-D-erythritol kinase n=1 Tax=Nocardioides pocheonensis TaxID=661485 RepID=A0A3N0GHE0_9ACTN|nr:4-(cytidine 5'-diphospho)-2-C-methyl-D-erythritol kinase [Nocardioides pocheonensis]